MSSAISDASRLGPSLQDDPRVRAFCSSAAPDLFHSITHHHDIWMPDPYDVEAIHAEARSLFQRLVSRATTPPGLPAGRILLLRGESGSGKTHLMRAFRNYVHGKGLGYCGYLQMTSAAGNYDRYVLSNLIDSLDHPYWQPERETSGLMRLARALAETPHSILPSEVQALREANLGPDELAKLVREMADNIVSEEVYGVFDLDLVRALLYLQRGDARIKKRVLAYVRCEEMSEPDRHMLGGIVPRKDDADPSRMIEQLGRLMAVLQSGCLVVFVDQLEEMSETGDNGDRFRRAMTTVCRLAERTPSSLWVIACLEDFYDALRGHLTKPQLDRIERDPEPLILPARRDAEQVLALIGQRLTHFYDSQEIAFRDEEPTFPFSPAVLDRLVNLRTRDVLSWCHGHRGNCIQTGAWLPPVDDLAPRPLPPTPAPLIDLEQTWNDFLAAHRGSAPDGEADLAALLAQTIETCSSELTTGHWFDAEVHQSIIHLETHGPENRVALAVIGLCNKSAQGGGLARQIKEVEHQAGNHQTIVVRSTDFPNNPKAKVVEQIGQLIARGGRRAVIEDSDWRAMLAFREFRQIHEQDGQFPEWLRQGQPLSRLKSLRSILGLDALAALPRPAAPLPSVDPANPCVVAAAPSEELPKVIVLGQREGRQPVPITLDPLELTRHAAFLGGSGSGKTTAALNAIEQLLLCGVPAVLVDRKGDLCGYARDRFGDRVPATEELARRRDRFRERVEVAVFTPGNPAGRPLSISLVPEGMAPLPTWEREHLAAHSAYALGTMMGYRDRGQDSSRVAILKQAILLLTTEPTAPVPTLNDLVDVIDGPDPALLATIGQLDAKLCRRLVSDLETLRLTKTNLFATEGEPLDTGRLWGLGPSAPPGRTRLSIISTKFLGDNALVEFWVARLLLELGRWIGKHPSPKLQAVLLFDEADLYLPAQRKPPTKEPMENLLKRARSAGIGILLASQSPGDFDYRCRDNVHTWFLGRITQPPALNKMKPLLNDCPGDVAAKLPHQSTGQFQLVREGTAIGLRSERSLLTTEQVPEQEILRLAQATAAAATGRTDGRT